MKLLDIASILKIKKPFPSIEIGSFETDTRTLKPNALFIALKGHSFNGHDFVEEAQKKGACAILASQEISSSLPVLKVADTLEALTQIAAAYRKTFNIPIIGLTGSCGKTTTKTLIGRIFEQSASTLSTEGTLNNHIGVPLMLMRLNRQHQYAVIEMGANHPGEIAHLTQLVQPTTVLITNIAPVHLEGFGSLKGVVQAKGEIFQGLNKGHTAIINADEPEPAKSWETLLQENVVIHFGIKEKAQIRAKDISLNDLSQARFTLVTPEGEIPIQLKLTGEHQVMNALAASSVAYVHNIPLKKIKAGLESLEEVNLRLCRHKTPIGATIIDDTYNANPVSTLAALKVLKKAGSPRIFVFGDMLELGIDAKFYHEQIGEAAKSLGIEKMYTYGNLTQSASEAFGNNAFHFTDKKQIVSALKEILKDQTTLLVKGSKAMKMWEIVKEIKEI